jgi:hypothetical protein
LKKGVILGNDSVIARSLKVTNATFLMVGSVTTLMACESMVILGLLNALGEAAILGLTFALGLVITSALATDLVLRSSQSVATLRSLGATRGAVFRSILTSVFIFGVAGTAFGVAAGAGLGLGAGGAASLGGTLVNAALVAVLTLAALGAGVFVGVMRSWRS